MDPDEVELDALEGEPHQRVGDERGAGARGDQPPEQAVWIPAQIAHEVHMPCAVHMRSLYFHPGRFAVLPTRCRVVAVTPLLRELIARLVTSSETSEERVARLVAVLLDEVQALRTPPLHLPMPHDTRLRRITDALIDDPADPRDLEAWSSSVGASTRTLSRLFRREVGMGFGAWRRQLRLISAIRRLGTGADVTSVAFDLGYGSPSAFIAMFRRVLGDTPARYVGRRATRQRDGAAARPPPPEQRREAARERLRDAPDDDDGHGDLEQATRSER